MTAAPIYRAFPTRPQDQITVNPELMRQAEARWRDADVPLRITEAEAEAMTTELPEFSDEEERHPELYIG